MNRIRPNRPQVLKEVIFYQLKNLRNVRISFGEIITGIFGTNGCGKSTVLQALACMYLPINIDNKNKALHKNGIRERLFLDGSIRPYQFSFFFRPTNISIWEGSKFALVYKYKTPPSSDKDKPLIKEYSKVGDRWKPRKGDRPKRDVIFFGIGTCMPVMEMNLYTKRSPFSKRNFENQELAKKIKESLSIILQRKYEALVSFTNNVNTYQGLTIGTLDYPSLYMGAGEQRILRMLEVLYTAPDNSLILIDEIDLTLHTDAINRLLKIMHREAKDRGIQIVFTSHREELLSNEYVTVRHLISDNSGMTSNCLERTTPECIRALSGKLEKKFTVYVEDSLAECLVVKVFEKYKLLPFTTILKMGSLENAFSIACANAINLENIQKVLIVCDGDRYRTQEEKENRLNKNITGGSHEIKEVRQRALSMLRQFKLPEKMSPEEFIKSTLEKQPDESNFILSYLKEIKVVENKHDYLKKAIENSGYSYERGLMEIVNTLVHTRVWDEYVSEIDNWAEERARQL